MADQKSGDYADLWLPQDRSIACTLREFLTITGLWRDDFATLVLRCTDFMDREYPRLPPLGLTPTPDLDSPILHFQAQWILAIGRRFALGPEDSATRWEKYMVECNASGVRPLLDEAWAGGLGDDTRRAGRGVGPNQALARVKQLESLRSRDAQALVDLAAAMLEVAARLQALEDQQRGQSLQGLLVEVRQRGDASIRAAFATASEVLQKSGKRRGKVRFPGGKERFALKASAVRKASESSKAEVSSGTTIKGGIDLAAEITGLAAKVAGAKGSSKVNMDLVLERARAVEVARSSEDQLSLEGTIEVDLDHFELELED